MRARTNGAARSPERDLERGARPGLWLASVWVFGALLVVALLAIDRAAPAGRGVIKITGVDTLAYYSVAHSLVYDGDLDLDNQYRALGADSHWLEEVPATGRRGSPFPLGYSLFQVPVLAAARGIEGLLGGGGGFGRISYLAYFLGNIFAACLGLSLLVTLLASFGARYGAGIARAPALAAGAALLTWAGTTLGYYTLSPMPHVVAFFAMTLFLWLWWRARDSDDLGRWALVGLAFGFLVLCRWQALLYAVIPPGYDLIRQRDWRASGRRWLVSRTAAALAALAAFTPQLLEWKAIYGRAILVPQGPGFIEWPPRYALRVLFSTHHGWFVWTPLTLLGVTGLLFVMLRPHWSGGPAWRDRFALALPFLVSIAGQVLLIGSLPTSWFNADSFSIRMLTTATPLVAVGLVALAAPGPRLRRATAALALLSVVYTLLFAVQFRLDLVPRDGRLTAQELVFDKLRPGRAWARHRAYRAARSALERGDAAIAAQTASEALEHFGSDRRLLAVLASARERAGQQAAAAEARRRLEEQNRRLLP